MKRATPTFMKAEFREGYLFEACVLAMSIIGIGEGKRWCQGSLAQTKSGQVCTLQDPRAYKFDLPGVFLWVLDWNFAQFKEIEEYACELGYEPLHAFNDKHSYEEVRRMLTRMTFMAVCDQRRFSEGTFNVEKQNIRRETTGSTG
jgi:hypothetical protein